MAGKETAGQEVQTVAREHPFHPVVDYLEALTWDRNKRISRWLPTYLGAKESEYTQAVGKKWLIGGVARVYRPGCKNDTCLNLEGAQGSLKSTALRCLADPWFTDDMPELGTKDSALQTRGVCLIELSELDSMNKTEISKVKAFMTRAVDRFRPPFGRRLIESPRECFFAGTTNQDHYLQDETGGRRFWPVRCGTILIDDLRRDRDQLLAEAVAKFRAGAVWWLTDAKTNAAAADEQRDRYVGDAWAQLIAAWVAGRESVSIQEVLALCIDKPKENWSQADQNRVARCLRAAKWERFRFREGQDLEWRYRRVENA
jgi:predicted P-loop ATPase